MQKTGPCRALLAFGARGGAVVLATDNADLAREIDAISDGGEDLGLTADGNEKPGLYLFEGEGQWCVYHDAEGLKSIELEWDGATRPVRPDEVTTLLAMVPPDLDLIAWGTDYREED